METLLRAPPGEDVSTERIDERTQILTRMVFTPDLIAQLNLSDDELHELLCTAEAEATDRGVTLERP